MSPRFCGPSRTRSTVRSGAKGATADQRAELNVQIRLLAETEITKLVVWAIADRMEVTAAKEQEVEEMKRVIAPEAVLDAIEGSAGR